MLSPFSQINPLGKPKAAAATVRRAVLETLEGRQYLYSFVLYNADTNKPIGQFENNTTIDYAFVTQNLSVQAHPGTGGVGYDRLRPLDAYGYWYARSVGWMLARALPRAALMVLAAGIVLPLVGLGDWAWRPPSGVTAALLFVPAFVLMTMLASQPVMTARSTATRP